MACLGYPKSPHVKGVMILGETRFVTAGTHIFYAGYIVLFYVVER